MANLCVSTERTRVPMPLMHRVWLAAVCLLLLLCSAGAQGRKEVIALSSTVGQGTAALSAESHRLLERTIGKAATFAQLHGQVWGASEVLEASAPFSGSEPETPRPSGTASTGARKLAITTIAVTASTKADAPTRSTTTGSPATTVGTRNTSEDATAFGRSHATFSAHALAGVVVGSIAGGVLLGVGAALLVSRSPCFLPCCKRRSPTEHKGGATAAMTHEIREAEIFVGSQRGSKPRNCVEPNQDSVKQASESGVLAVHNHSGANPLALPSLQSPKCAPPPIAGDPTYVNNFSNRPHVENGIVPWTGRPPVLRGPQPACVVPTITKEGKVIPREQRVLPGLGLFKTPIIPITLPLPPPLPKTKSAGAFARVESFRPKELRRSHGPMSAEEEQATVGAAKKDQPVIQWFFHLVYFTAVDKTPEISDLDESGSDEDEKHDDDVATIPAESVCPIATVVSAASAGATAKPPLPEAAVASVSAPLTDYATAGMPVTRTDWDYSQYLVSQGTYGVQHYPSTNPQTPENPPQMAMRDLSHVVSCPVAPPRDTSDDGDPYSFFFAFQKPLSPQLHLNQKQALVFPQQKTLSQVKCHSSSSVVSDGEGREL